MLSREILIGIELKKERALPSLDDMERFYLVIFYFGLH
jgi:hypothetical protein